jgi:hypothetical protein
LENRVEKEFKLEAKNKITTYDTTILRDKYAEHFESKANIAKLKNEFQVRDNS